MSINELTREQKQYLGLGILTTIVLILLVVFGIRFSLTSMSVAKDELAGLKQKVENAQRVLGSRANTRDDFSNTITTLKDHLENLPPERNYYSWAMEIIYDKASRSHLEISSIDEMSSIHQGGAAKNAESLTLEAYSLRIAAQGGYESVKRFLKDLNQDQPLVRVTGIEISSGRLPEIHNVQIFIQWPFGHEEIRKTWEDVKSRQQNATRTPVAAIASTEPLPVEQAVTLEGAMRALGGNR